MATFEKILEEKILLPVKVRLGGRRFYDRKMYAYPASLKWMKEIVPTLVSGRLKSAQTPAEQLIMRLQQWLSGAPINKGPMFQEMKYPADNNVWEMKTDDLRMFGWIYQPKIFIVAAHGYTDDYKDPTKIKYYADDVRAVMQARVVLPLDDPKFVKGDFDDLV